MGDLAADTALEGAGGRYSIELSRDWEIWGPNGGYLAAIALRAAGAEAKFPRPASFYCQFLAVADFGLVDLEVTTLRSSKRAQSVRVSMTQNGGPILEALVWVVGEVDGLVHDFTIMPDVPGPEELLSSDEIWGDQDAPYPFWRNLDARGPLTIGKGNGLVLPVPFAERLGGWLCWYRFKPTATFDDPFVDACRYLILLDTLMWPAASVQHPHPAPFIAPSIDVSIRFHRFAPAEEWLLCDAQSKIAHDGLVAGISSIWSPEGGMVASGGQQMLCRPSPFF